MNLALDGHQAKIMCSLSVALNFDYRLSIWISTEICNLSTKIVYDHVTYNLNMRKAWLANDYKNYWLIARTEFSENTKRESDFLDKVITGDKTGSNLKVSSGTPHSSQYPRK